MREQEGHDLCVALPGGSMQRRHAIVGFGMNGRGAVEIVVASVILKLSNELLSSGAIEAPLLTQNQFSALILMAFLTTLMAPLTLKWAVTRACSGDEQSSFCILWDKRKS